MDDSEEEELLKKLRSNDVSCTLNALIEIRKNYARNYEKMRRLSKSAVIKILISFLEHPKFCNISLSIIADACLERNIAFEVIQNGGISSLLRIMRSLVNDEVQNRACRALGNIAKTDVGFKAVHTVKPVSNIINFLNETKDENCQQTAARTLHILGTDSKSREIIVRENGIIYLTKLLHSTNNKVVLCTIKALADLTKNCSIGCARQMLEMHSLEMLVKLSSHSEKDIKMHALITLKNLSAQENIRSDLVKVGVIKRLTEVAMEFKSPEMSRLAILALCYCIDHLHMWENYGVPRHTGLKTILEILRHCAFEDIHVHIIKALLPLCYDKGVPDILFELEIIEILILNLKNFISRNQKEHSDPIPQSLNFNNDVFTPLPAKEMETFVNDELSSSSIQSLSSEEHEISPIEKYLEKPKFASEITRSDFSQFSSVNSRRDFCPVKRMPKFYSSIHFHSSGASSNCSPSSPGSSSAVSPIFSDCNPSSPDADPWSPESNTEETVWCWSPVLRSPSSPSVENDIELQSENPIQTKTMRKPDKSVSYSKAQLKVSPKNAASTLFKNSQTLSSDNLKKYNLAFNSPSELSTDKKKHSKVQALHHKDKEFSRPISKKHKATDQKFHTVLEEGPGNKKLKTSVHCPKRIQKKLFSDKSTIDDYVLDLLTRLSFHLGKQTNSAIADKSCFSVLMDYIVLMQNPNPKAEKLLLNLIKNRYCFEKLIMSGFVTEIEEKMSIVHSPKDCIRCMQIDNIHCNLLSALRPEAESDFGVGTLCHILATAKEPSQLYAIHCISILIVLKSALFKLVIQKNGLSLLLKFLVETSETTCSIAIFSLFQLYQNIRKTKTSEILERCCFSGTCDFKMTSKCAYKDALFDVTFCVNGISVSACRETICTNSEYFSALLKGHFSEKYKDVITMSEISVETLTTIFHFLHGCQIKNICPYIRKVSFAVLLEMVNACEKFLLFDVKTFIEDKLCHSLSPETVSRVYQTAKIFNSSALCDKALHFLLSMDVTQKDVLLKCFQEFMILEQDLHFLNEVKLFIQNIFQECIYKYS